MSPNMKRVPVTLLAPQYRVQVMPIAATWVVGARRAGLMRLAAAGPGPVRGLTSVLVKCRARVVRAVVPVVAQVVAQVVAVPVVREAGEAAAPAVPAVLPVVTTVPHTWPGPPLVRARS